MDVETAALCLQAKYLYSHDYTFSKSHFRLLCTVAALLSFL